MPQAPARLSGSQALDTPFPSADAQLRRDLAQGGYTPHGTAEGAYDAYDAAPQAPPRERPAVLLRRRSASPSGGAEAPRLSEFAKTMPPGDAADGPSALERQLEGVAGAGVGAFVGLMSEGARAMLSSSDGVDYAVDVQNAILAFAGRVLLRGCDLRFERGRRCARGPVRRRAPREPPRTPPSEAVACDPAGTG